MSDKQLSQIDFKQVRAKADSGQALSLRELATVTGFGYTQVRGWSKSGLPVFYGRVFYQDFLNWKQKVLESKSGPGLERRLAQADIDKSVGPRTERGLRSRPPRSRERQLERLLR